MSVFGGQNALKIVSRRACFQVIFLSISGSAFQRLGLKNRDFRIEGIATIEFAWTSFLIDSGLFLSFFLKPWGPFS